MLEHYEISFFTKPLVLQLALISVLSFMLNYTQKNVEKEKKLSTNIYTGIVFFIHCFIFLQQLHYIKMLLTDTVSV